jgi:hypothetical protein
MRHFRPGVVVQSCNPSTRQEDPEFQTTVGYMTRLCLKKEKKRTFLCLLDRVSPVLVPSSHSDCSFVFPVWNLRILPTVGDKGGQASRGTSVLDMSTVSCLYSLQVTADDYCTAFISYQRL